MDETFKPPFRLVKRLKRRGRSQNDTHGAEWVRETTDMSEGECELVVWNGDGAGNADKVVGRAFGKDRMAKGLSVEQVSIAEAMTSTRRRNALEWQGF